MQSHELHQALERMMLIRAYEEAGIALQAEGRAPGTCTSVGQEASAVGVISALSTEDLILTNHRSAGHLLARGADPGRIIAEVMGKAGGYCQGNSGSLHISAKELGVVLTSTIVGGELGLSTGVGLSRSMQGGEGIVACFFGDGAAAEGRFHEALNLAAVWSLPIFYVCENNEWQAYVHRRETMVVDSIAARAAGYGVEGATVDGNDVEAVYAAAKRAVDFVRRDRKPYLLETLTYRLRGHYEPDDQSYVDAEELTRWKRRDPIDLLKQRLQISDSDLRRIEAAVKQKIDAALAFAEASPYPSPDSIANNVYA